MPTLKKAKKYIDKAREVENKYNIPTNTLVGLLATESNFNPNAISPSKAKGIAQFLDSTAKEFGIDPYNTDQAIDAAGKYLASSYKTFGNWEDSLRSYNMGVQGVKDWKRGIKKLSKETQEYTGKVWKFAKMYGGKTIPETNTTQNKQEVTSKETPTQYNYTPQNTTTVTNLPETEKTVNFEEEQAKIAQATNQKEQDFLKEYQESFSQQEEVEQEEEPVYQLPQTNYVDMFNQVSQFVDSGVAQQGVQKDMYNNDILSTIVDSDNDRSQYKSRTNTIYLANDYRTWVKDKGDQNKLVAHENYHAKQHRDDRTNFDIAHNTDNKFWAQMQKRPEMMSTDDVYYNFHNRKNIESNIDVNNFAKQVPEAQFFRNAFGNIAFDKKIDGQQYNNPETEEGEAQFYQYTGQEFHKLQQGGKQNYTENELAFLSEIAIKDNQGQYKHEGKITEISSPNITMKNLNYDVLGISKQTGEKKLMKPEKNYFFKNTKDVIEIPLK